MRSEDDDDERIFRELQRMPGTKQAMNATKTGRRGRDPFVQVPWWWAIAAAKATRTPKLLVCIELLHRSWKAKSLTFTLPNGRLRENGVNRETKRRVLRDLERAGLITIEKRGRKSPQVTLVLI